MYIKISGVEKSYGKGEGYTKVLSDITTVIDKGDICVVLGASGSGKSTLLNVVGGLESVDSGSVIVNDKEISNLRGDELNDYRRTELGFVFQFYNLIPNLTIKENIQVCEYLTENPMDITELINVLGLENHINKFPYQLSGGQQQRCAIARALIKKPKLLLCDEPTGALDSQSAKEILILIEKINKKYGTTVLMVTHNSAVQNMASRVIRIKDGTICEDYKNKNVIDAEKIEW